MEDLEIIDKKIFSEVYDVLKFCSDDLFKKIPKKLIKFIDDNRDKNYITTINPYVSLEEQEIQEDTKVVLALLYRNYFADEDEKQNFYNEDIQEIQNEENIKREKYNPDDIFKNKEIPTTQEITSLLVVKNENIFRKILSFIKNIFIKK